MPRLIHTKYLEQRAALQQLWLDQQHAFGWLPHNAQADLHAYFQPTATLSDLELRQHRKAVAEQDPSFPNRAGKAFKQPQAHLSGEKPIPKPSSKIYARGIVRPAPDLDLLVQALVHEVLQDPEREAA